MKKKLLTILLSIAVILTSTVTVFADDNQVLIVGGSSFSTVQAAVDAAENNQTIKLNGNCKENVNIPEEKTVTIDLNGNVLTGAGTGSVITVCGNLTLTDSSSTKTGKVTGGKATGGNGGGVYVGGGSFEMTGGTITGNEAGHGGGIFVASDAQTIITNGIIENNHTTQAGAGVQVDGSFIMTGGTIKNNKADGDGGGLSINGDTGKATLAGTTEIINNTANGKGGGVSYYSNSNKSGKVVLGGKVKIVGNVENGTIAGGTLTGDTTNNVYLYSNNLCIAIGTDTYAPTDGMLVGITTYTPPTDTPVKFTTNGTDSDVQHFFSDNGNYKISFNSGTLELKVITIADILATADGGFPTTEADAWSNDNGKKMYIDNNGLTFGSVNTYSILSQPVTKDGNNYKYILNPHTITFVMDSNKLVKVIIEDNGNADNNGEYIPSHTHGTGTEAITFEKEIKTFAELHDLFTTGGSGYFANDIIATAGLTVKANIDLCLNGKKLNLDGKGNITVSSGKTLNLYDCGTNGTITGGTAEHGGGVYVNSGTFNMYGGSITDNKAQYGGGVDNNGTFKMYGGKITNNYASQGGGGINLNGTFNMYGGEITKNETANNKNGGGVYANRGSFTMNGGTITDNKAQYGAGVYVYSSANFIMTDDSVISGNTGGQGAGIYSIGTFTMSGNSEITGNAGTFGGGVGIGGGTFTMTESSKIANNKGNGCGGVYIHTGSFKMAGGTITGNTAANCGGVSIMSNGNFEMTGGTITGNTATGYGGVLDSGTITLGGSANITGNVKGGTITGGVLTGGTANNIFLPNSKYITLDTDTKPTNSFKVGVTTETVPTETAPVKITTNGTASDVQHFFSDNGNYKISFNSGTLELKVITIADILATVDGGFPTSSSTAWITEQGLYTCRLDSSNLRFYIDGGEYIATTTAPVTPSGDDYVYTDEDGSVTFNMENGKLTSITVMVNGDDNTYVYALRFGVTIIGGNYVKGYLVDKGTVYSVSGNTLTVGDKTDTAGAIEGKEFDFWKIGETPVTEDGTITEDTTFVATYKVVHTHALVLVNGQAATESAAGWKDYYECACGALFEDENGTTPIENLATWKAEGGNGYIAPLAPSIDYEIISGNNANINIDNNKDALFTSDAEYSKFERVEVDGVIVDSSNYSVVEGSTKVTLKASYLSTLSVGQHTIDIISTDGHASTTFTITKNSPSSNPGYVVPNTGVEGAYSNNHSLLKLSSLSLLAIGTYIVIKKKKNI